MSFYNIENTVVPMNITLTPTTVDHSNYRVTWTPSYYNTSRYMITVYPPESYTHEDLIIHNTDNSTVHNITIALNDCPNRIYSTFVLGIIIEVKIKYTLSNTLSCMLNSTISLLFHHWAAYV